MAELCDFAVEELKSDFARLDGEVEWMQTGLEVEVENFGAANGDDAPALMGFNPTEGRIHEKKSEFTTAMLLEDGEKSDLIKAVIKGERKRVAIEIFVDRIGAGARGCDADKTVDILTDRRNDVNIAAIQSIAEFAFGVLRVL